ncbi:unnamed protein product, partial [Strongylus vulgaris]
MNKLFPRLPFPFNPFEHLNETDLSAECLRDVTTYSAGLTAFTETFLACRQNGSCTMEQQKVLQENIFAIQQIDASGKIPSGLLELTLVSSGSYSECMAVIAPYQVQYCYVDVAINMTGPIPGVEVVPKFAVCMPESCTDEDITNFLNSANPQELLIEFTGTNCVPTRNSYPASFWIFMTVLAFLISWLIIATVVDYVWQNRYMDKEQNKAVRILLAYSIYSNGSLLLNVSPPKEGTLKSLASIRFISMTWVVAGHVLMQDASSDTFAPVLNLWNPLLSTTILNAFFSVDTFFILSGILVSYIFFKSKPTARYVKNPLVWVMFYVHRYVRLTPPIMVFIGFYVIMDPFVSGPWAKSLMPLFDMPHGTCKKYWWRNLLYINNFFKFEEICYIITWYLSVDTQLYFVAPVFLILLSIAPIAGFLLIFACVAASVGI